MNFASGKKLRSPLPILVERERESAMRKMSMEIQFPELLKAVYSASGVSFDLPGWVGGRKVDSVSRRDISC